MNWRASRASEILRMVDDSNGLSSTTELELLRRAALLADAEGDKQTAISARRSLVHSLLWANSDADVVAAFVWLLHSTPVDHDLLWTYKWVIELMVEFASIGADLLNDALEALERRYKVAGLSTAPAAQLRFEVAAAMRQRSRLPELFAAWQRDESGSGSDCPACRRDRRVTYFALMEDDERVVSESRPFLEESLQCAEVPRGTYPVMLLPYLRAGRVDEADDICRRGIETLSDKDRIPSGLGSYLVYTAIRGRIEQGFGILATWMRRILLSRNDLRRYEFFRGAALLFRATAEHKMGVVHLTLPPTWEQHQPEGLYEVEQLRAWFDERAQDLATRFDARNGNTEFHNQLRHDAELLRLSA